MTSTAVEGAIGAAGEELWRSFFAHPAYVGFSAQIQTPAKTGMQLDALRRLLGLEPGSRVLDLGCGHGRLTLPLARLGCDVTGLDASLPLLERARAAAADAGLDIELVHCDMVDLDAEAAFDAVVNVGTAFGYVTNEREDAAALEAVRRALRPRGRLLVETENREYMLRQPPREWFDMDGATVWTDRRFDPRTARWTETLRWLVGENADVGEASYSIRLYAVTELERLLEAAGFAIDGVWGGLDESPYELASRRLAVRAVARE